VCYGADSRTRGPLVAETIRRLHVSGRAFREIAVLSALGSQCLPASSKTSCARQGIPYVNQAEARAFFSTARR